MSAGQWGLYKSVAGNNLKEIPACAGII